MNPGTKMNGFFGICLRPGICAYFCSATGPLFSGIRAVSKSGNVMTQRQQKFSRLIQKELGAIFQQDTKSMFGASFITVSGVNVSPDLGIATVYLSLTLTKKPQLVLEEIREKSKQIRSLLAGKIRHQVRIIPELRFFADETLLEAERIDKLIASLNIPPVTPGEQEES
jgi:ribosome-binding factor A